ncbi:MAG: hypothetical protein AABW90_01990 [Nanoarchaeota archaeon]
MRKRFLSTERYVIKLNYIFTISEKMVEKNLFSISEEKKRKVKEELISRIK